MNTSINKDVIAISVPTGIGADIGGYAGDFGYLAREFAKHFHVVVNPNAVNGGILSAINYDMSYLEGHLFDEFILGHIGIIPKKPYMTNKIGIIFDSDIPNNIINVHLNTLSAMKMVKGINVEDIIYTDEPVGVEIVIENAISVGNLLNPDTILKAAKKLIDIGCEAIAIVCNFNDDAEDINYNNGDGIDPIGGVEAIISHLITKEYKIPAAHAPAFSTIDISENLENEKVSSELISSTYLPCIIEGLSIAPEIIPDIALINDNSALTYKDIKYLIVPNDALGSAAVLGAIENNIKIITIKNKTKMNITKEKLNIKPHLEFDSYTDCLNYLTN